MTSLRERIEFSARFTDAQWEKICAGSRYFWTAFQTSIEDAEKCAKDVLGHLPPEVVVTFSSSNAQRSLQQLQDEVGEWSDKTFPGQTIKSKIKHLQREVKELLATPDDKIEQADCLILLIDIVRLTGRNADDLISAAFSKFELCKQRQWKPADNDGVFQHVKDGRP